MAKVDNRKIISRISLASLKNNRSRNIIAIIAIILTTLLFTTLFTVGFGMKESMELQTMRMVGTTFHGGFKHLDEEQFEALKEHKLIKEYGHRRLIGSVINEELKMDFVEISYGDENYVKRGFSYPTVGNLPKEKNEIITDTKVLDLLGVPHRIGEKVFLKFEIYDSKKGMVVDTLEKEFILSGFYPVDPLSKARMVFTSREYVDSLNLPEGNLSLNIMFSNSVNIEDKLNKIIEEKDSRTSNQDPNYISIGVNWGYMAEGLGNADPTVVIGGIAIIIIILSAGYLIIYNIFQISVLTDIRFYGLLKTVGTTSKQLKRIIRRQALILSAFGIPLGLILGYLVGNLLIPFIVKELNFDSTVRLSFSPFIFLFSSIFSLVTVLISSSKPSKIAGRVSPIEATKMDDTNLIDYDKEKRTEREVKISNMAIANLSRNKLRTIIVIFSMSLSLILFSSIYTFTGSFDEEKYVDGFMSTDFTIGSSEYFKYRFREEKDSLSTDIIRTIESTEGFKNGGCIYYSPFDDIWIEDKGLLELEGKAPAQIFGLDPFLIPKQEVLDGSIDLEKFMSGGYILLGVGYENTDRLEDLKYRVGDKITFLTKEGRKEFEVMALISYSYKNTARYFPMERLESGDTIRAELIYLPTSIYKGITDQSLVMVYQFDVENEKIEDIELMMDKLSKSSTLDLNYESRQMLIDDYKSFKNMFFIVGSTLSIMIGIVGVMNFINSIITSIMARKKEFALLQSIGMTNKQVNSLLVKEGLIYSLSTMIATSFFSTLISITILKGFERGMPFYTYNFTILPLLIVLPIILLLGVIVPLLVNQTMVKESIVERIRKN